jgi:hypothetical protein
MTFARGKVMCLYNDGDNLCISESDVFHGTMLPDTPEFDDLLIDLLKADDEHDYAFKVLQYNEKYFHYPDFKMTSHTFFDYFKDKGYFTIGAEKNADPGSYSNNREANIAISKCGDKLGAEVIFIRNFSNKTVYVYEHQKWYKHLPVYNDVNSVKKFKRDIIIIFMNHSRPDEQSGQMSISLEFTKDFDGYHNNAVTGIRKFMSNE